MQNTCELNEEPDIIEPEGLSRSRRDELEFLKDFIPAEHYRILLDNY